ncbi:hypothetical protein [Microbulbifer sp. SAOS-129_SWC]|uniref:DUF7706 family protein n=1 Tax=Microbulbifer sp. SAOS-129_SWC TaxID=3145235 RepID=UPI0032170BC1
MANHALTNAEVSFQVVLTVDEALAFLKFLKRAGHSDYKKFADTRGGDAEVYEMLYAGEKIRAEIAATGFYCR